jgi:hypothetical protein
MSTKEKLIQFANQKPGLSFADYGDRKIYFAEMREITKDLHDFRELLNLALIRLGSNLEEKLTEYLSKSSGRLTLENGKLQYCTGQYFPTEYRPACNFVLRSLIWDSFRTETDSEGNYIYTTGPEIRKAISRNLSRRVCKNYFN